MWQYHSNFHNSRILWGTYQIKSSGLCEILVIIEIVIITTTFTIYWKPQIWANKLLTCIRWVLTLQWKKLDWNSNRLSNLSKVMNQASSRARIWTQVYWSLEPMLTPLRHAGIDRGRQDIKSYMYAKCVHMCCVHMVHECRPFRL